MLATKQSFDGLAGRKEVYLEQDYQAPGQPVVKTYVGVYLYGPTTLDMNSVLPVLGVNVKDAEDGLADEIKTLNAQKFNMSYMPPYIGNAYPFWPQTLDYFSDGINGIQDEYRNPLCEFVGIMSSLPSGTVKYYYNTQVYVNIYSRFDYWMPY